MPGSVMPREVRNVRDALHHEFDQLIDMSDVEGQPDQREQHFLSRALAALVTRKLTGGSSPSGAAAVTDGRGDTGIDAVAISDSGLHLWLIQSKWSDRGNAGFSVADGLKLIEGLKLIDAGQFDRFNARFQLHAERVAEVLRDPRTKITLVVVLMGQRDLHPDVVQRLKDAEEEFNSLGPILNYETWDLKHLWETIRDDLAEPPLNLTAKMEEWTLLAEPFEAYQGRVSVAEIAEWYSIHGDRLFKQNIRKSLGLTEVNHGLVETLTQNPSHFWYYNNGITLLCATAERHNWSRASRGPVELHLRDASVVNGAQTVTAIYEAMQKNSEVAGEGYVGVKIITTKNCPDDFSVNVTRNTNTQNRVERRDFVALDPAQEKIREDFTLALDKLYSFKRGDMVPPPEAGCSIVEAAIALACAYHNPEMVARVKQNVDLLWESGPTGAYNLLFGKVPAAYRIWRSVLTVRTVRGIIHDRHDDLEGRARVIAEQGDLLVNNIVFQQLESEEIDDPDHDWESVLENISEAATEGVFDWLVYHLDNAYGPTSYIGSTFANVGRCQLLASRVMASLKSGHPIPDLPSEYRSTVPAPRVRQPNAVPILINSGVIPDGTILTYVPVVKTEQKALAEWLREDPRRGQASWINNRSKPLLWAYDGQRYSPSGLVSVMWEQAGWEGRHKAAAGPARWHVAGAGSLWDLSRKALSEVADSAARDSRK
jgi:AIPR protein